MWSKTTARLLRDRNCPGYALLQIARGLIVSGNIFRRTPDQSVIVERGLDCDVIGNTFVDDGKMAVWLKNFSGNCSRNSFVNSGWSGIYLACAGVAVGATLGCAWIEDNHSSIAASTARTMARNALESSVS